MTRTPLKKEKQMVHKQRVNNPIARLAVKKISSLFMMLMLALCQCSLALASATGALCNPLPRSQLRANSRRQQLKLSPNKECTHKPSRSNRQSISITNDSTVSKLIRPPFLIVYNRMDPQQNSQIVTMHEFINQDQSQRVAQQQE